MIDIKVLLALALLFGTMKPISHRPPAGGIPIPQRTPGTDTAPGLN
jgi:hypothetical protein